VAASPVADATVQATLVRFAAPAGARRRLVCLPFAGGGVATYRTWVTSLPGDVEVVAVQLPGRSPSRREPAPDSIDALVMSVLPALAGLDELPFAIFGHSMGALLAFELTVALEGAGAATPEHLFVSGRRSPDAPLPSRPIHGLADDDFLDAIDGRYGGVPAAVRQEPDLLTLLLPALRADIRALETYVPSPGRQVRCPVHVFGGAADTNPRPDELQAWQGVAASPVSVRVFDGDHFYLRTDPTGLTAEIGRRWSRPAGVEPR
jgi:surfactin synthase thioesterase subunit